MSDGGKKDGKVKLKLWVTSASHSCCDQYAATDENMSLPFFFQTRYAIHSPSFYTQHSSWRAKKVLFDVLLSFINMLIKLALSEGCHRYGSISRIFNDACGMINNSH